MAGTTWHSYGLVERGTGRGGADLEFDCDFELHGGRYGDPDVIVTAVRMGDGCDLLTSTDEVFLEIGKRAKADAEQCPRFYGRALEVAGSVEEAQAERHWEERRERAAA